MSYIGNAPFIDIVDSVNIVDGSLITADLADGAVTTIKLADLNVTTAKLAADAVTAAKLAADAVTTAKILDANVTATKLAADAVTTAKIIDGAVTAAKLASGAVSPTAISDQANTSTGWLDLPAGTTAQQGTPTSGAIRYNTTTNMFEGYGSAWGSLGGGATGAGGDQVFQENQLVVTTSYTLSSSKSAMSVGPITINGGAVVTIPGGHRWVIL